MNESMLNPADTSWVLTATALVGAWSVAASFVLLKGIDRFIGLRASEQEERHGLDLSLHNETGYNL